MIKGVVFDFGDTLVEQIVDKDQTLDTLDLKLLPGAKECLMQLAPLYKLGLLCNTETTTTDQLEKALANVGLNEFGIAAFASITIGVKKPHPRTFLTVANALQLKPEELVMVGNDLEEDIGGALNVGMSTIYVSQETPAPPIIPDAQVKGVNEITPALIEALSAKKKV